MEIGIKVSLKNSSDFGIGQIIDKKTVFGKNFYKVFFSKNSQILDINEVDLIQISSLIDMLKIKDYSSPLQFKLKAISHQLLAMSTGDFVLSPANFKIKPLPHQIIALNFVINQFKPRCLLADEVGLGKTIEAALIFEELKMRGMVNRVLIVTPATLTTQWQEELKLKFNENFYVMNKSSSEALENLYGEKGNIWFEHNQVITSIDFLKPKKITDNLSTKELKRREKHNQRIFDDCIKANWDVVIIDEAHKLTKDYTGEITSRYKLGEALSKVSPIFLLLSATPHKGKPYIFKNLLQLLDEYMFFSVDDLIPENVRKVTVRNKKRASVDLEGDRLFKQRITEVCPIDRSFTVEEELYNAVTEYVTEYYNYAVKEGNKGLIFLLIMYQRIVSSSTKAILSSLEKRLSYLSSYKIAKERAFYEDEEEFLDKESEEQLDILENSTIGLKAVDLINKEINIVENCIFLAKQTLLQEKDSKLNMVLEIIDEIKKRENEPNLKMIIFTEFKVTQKYIREELEKKGYKVAIINGDLSLDEKMSQKQYFSEEADFLISTDAGGEGINLQFCSHMINYDLPWNPMKLEQRIGRIDRIGQKKDVKIFNFVIKNSIEERVRELIEVKLEIIKNQFGEDQLRDILSTLQEDFSFDKIYFDAIVLREKESSSLESIAQNMFEEAKKILEEDNFLIPFVNEDNLSKEQKKAIVTVPNKVKGFLADFLSLRGIELSEYAERKNTFYFKNNFKPHLYGNHFKNIIFNPQAGLDYENTDLLGIKNDFVQDIILETQDIGYCTSIVVNDSRFSGKRGIITYWEIVLKNNYDYKKSFYIPIFIESEGILNNRISQIFDDFENINFSKSLNTEISLDIESLIEIAKNEIEKEAENIYIKYSSQWEDKINEKKLQFEKYFYDKERAIKQIPIDNIRESKLKSMLEEKSNNLIELTRKKNLVPEIEMKQIAYITFGV